MGIQNAINELLAEGVIGWITLIIFGVVFLAILISIIQSIALYLLVSQKLREESA